MRQGQLLRAKSHKSWIELFLFFSIVTGYWKKGNMVEDAQGSNDEMERALSRVLPDPTTCRT
jgi:hypothetical protein